MVLDFFSLFISLDYEVGFFFFFKESSLLQKTVVIRKEHPVLTQNCCNSFNVAVDWFSPGVLFNFRGTSCPY